MMIHTDRNGVPIECPEPPAPGAGIEAKIAWLRAHSAYRDRLISTASAAFDRSFRKALNSKRSK